MSRSHLASPGIVTLAAVVVLTCAGCASTSGNSLDAHQDRMVRRLTGECYWHHEGARVVYGGLEVYTACREWASRKVRVSMPGG